MSFLDKAKDLIGEHSDEIDKGVDKAAELADQQTDGKYSEQIDQAAEQVKDKIGGVLGESPQDPPATAS